jgi:hypothetical protein
MSLPRRLALFSCLFMALISLGCGESDLRKMVPIKGKLLVKGQPVKPPEGGKINLSFKPASGERGESIEVKSDGSFAGNANAGQNSVTVIVYGANEMGAPAAAKLGIKEQYVSDATSTLKADVASGKDLSLEVGE